MDFWLIVILVLLLMGGGPALYWGMTMGWRTGPLALLAATAVAAILLFRYRARRQARLLQKAGTTTPAETSPKNL
jgi:hypothetical protein